MRRLVNVWDGAFDLGNQKLVLRIKQKGRDGFEFFGVFVGMETDLSPLVLDQ